MLFKKFLVCRHFYLTNQQSAEQDSRSRVKGRRPGRDISCGRLRLSEVINNWTDVGRTLSELWEPVLLSLPVTPAPFLLLSSAILFWMWVEGVRVTQSVTSLLSFSFRPPSKTHKRFDTPSAQSLTAARTTWNFPPFGQSGELSFLFRLEWTVAVGFDNSKLSNWNLRGFNSRATTCSFLW